MKRKDPSEITLEDEVVERYAMNRLYDYVIEAMEKAKEKKKAEGEAV